MVLICFYSVAIVTGLRCRGDPLLEPLLDGVEGVDGHGVDHGDLLVVVLVDDDHVEVLQVELHTLKVDQLHLVQSDHERRLDAEHTEKIFSERKPEVMNECLR